MLASEIDPFLPLSAPTSGPGRNVLVPLPISAEQRL